MIAGFIKGMGVAEIINSQLMEIIPQLALLTKLYLINSL